MFHKNDRDRFWSRVDVRGMDECWPWIGRAVSGVGVFDYGEGEEHHRIAAHRAAAVIAGGMKIEGVRLRQRCGNRLCCNPSHLDCPSQTIAPPGGDTYNHSERNQFSLGPMGEPFHTALMPLLSGKPVVLTMDDPRFARKKNYLGSKDKRLVILTPGQMLGFGRHHLLVSIVGSGSCIVRLGHPKSADLVLAGMPAKLANVLMDKIHQVFKEK